MKKILGLDLGTNSIGWAVINASEQSGKQSLKPESISAAGSRIIPMDAETMGKFESGASVSATSNRTQARGMRRLYQRFTLRRERLNRVLSLLQFLPEHYASHLNRYGQLQKGVEPKLPWAPTDHGMQFLFEDSFQEMMADFMRCQPQLLLKGKKIPYDWTIYYLRKKALTQALTPYEFAWLLHQFNQKRGYYQLRGEEEEEQKETERKEFYSLCVKEVRSTGDTKNGRTWYEVILENGWIYRRQSSYPLDWAGKIKNFIVTTQLNPDGTEKLDKEGQVRRSFKSPTDDDWTLLKVKTEQDIQHSGKTVGEFIYDALLHDPSQKLVGQLVRVVDRKFYREEILRIVRKQMEFLPQLTNSALYEQCIQALYPQNEAYRQSIARRGFEYLLVDDVIFYQRPLRTKKYLIDECSHEFHTFVKEGKTVRQYLKCIPASHPLYEEFRTWQFLSNLRIYRTEGLHTEDVTDQYLPTAQSRVELFRWLYAQAHIKQENLCKQLDKANSTCLSWNYVADREYPMAPARADLLKAAKTTGVTLSEAQIIELWHRLYSISDKQQLQKAIDRYTEAHQLPQAFAEKLKKIKPYDSQYGAFSEKAIKRLLALMRCGELWSAEAIDKQTRLRIEHLLTGEADDHISLRTRENCASLSTLEAFQGLPVWQAELVVYDARVNDTKWHTPDDIDTYLHSFRQHSLNNPVVEQVVTETLRTVRDIWRQEGQLDEIHLEMGRDLKNPAAKRKQMQDRQLNNERANLRARLLLTEFMNPELEVEGVLSYSPSQQEKFRIYEEGILAQNDVPDDIRDFVRNVSVAKQPTAQEVRRYRLWLEQRYQSPYTGETIPLSKLFTPAYEIEHIIPQSLYFDDSFSNKVICEAEVNKLKDRQLAHQFIQNHGGQTVMLSGGRKVTVLYPEAYEERVNTLFAGDKQKQRKLMLDDIPDDFINRQLSDSRYISRLMKGLLSNIVRTIDPKTGQLEIEETSRNLIVCNGATTDRLKKDWGINDAWNQIILPRFERLNQLLQTDVYTARTRNGHLIPNMPLAQQQGFNKKRIDHRHHAMDALVIACTTREHVNLLSNESALSQNHSVRVQLNHLLRERETVLINGQERQVFKTFRKPWDTYTQDVLTQLQQIIVSFKQNLRVINRTTNHSLRFVDGKKQLVPQTQGDNWAIRKSMHKATGFGLVNLRFKKTVNLKQALQLIDDIVDRDLRHELRRLSQMGLDEKQIKKHFESEPDVWKDIDFKKIEVYYYSNDTRDRYYATRTAIDESFDEKTIREKVTDTGAQKILQAHLAAEGGDPKQAFSADGLERMNKNIQALNDGVPHKPIYKVRKYEKADKFAVGTVGAKAQKFVEADKGTNLFYAVYEADGKRQFVTVPLKVAIDCQKQGQLQWHALMDQWIKQTQQVTAEAKLLFVLSPGDLVYLPTEAELQSGIYSYQKGRIYRAVSFSGKQCFFVSSTVASAIIDKVEFSALNKAERAITGEMIKETCVPFNVDRLGNIL